MPVQHIPIEMLSAYTGAETSDDESLRVQLHVEQCIECREELESLRRLLDDVRHLPVIEARAGFVNRVMAATREPAPFFLRAFIRKWQFSSWIAVGVATMLTLFFIRSPELDQLKSPALTRLQDQIKHAASRAPDVPEKAVLPPGSSSGGDMEAKSDLGQKAMLPLDSDPAPEGTKDNEPTFRYGNQHKRAEAPADLEAGGLGRFGVPSVGAPSVVPDQNRDRASTGPIRGFTFESIEAFGDKGSSEGRVKQELPSPAEEMPQGVEPKVEDARKDVAAVSSGRKNSGDMGTKSPPAPARESEDDEKVALGKTLSASQSSDRSDPSRETAYGTSDSASAQADESNSVVERAKEKRAAKKATMSSAPGKGFTSDSAAAMPTPDAIILLESFPGDLELVTSAVKQVGGQWTMLPASSAGSERMAVQLERGGYDDLIGLLRRDARLGATPTPARTPVQLIWIEFQRK